MGLKRPPQHRADARAVYICQADEAWDEDRIEDEKRSMAEAGEDPEMHPVAVYYSGETRYDMGARYPVCGEDRSPQDYIVAGEAPTKFGICALRSSEMYEVADLLAAEKSNQAFLLACRKGLVSVEGAKIDCAGQGKKSRVTSKGIEDLLEFGSFLPVDIGLAIWNLSQPPTEAEKKPSGLL